MEVRQLTELTAGEYVCPCMERMGPRGTDFHERYDVGGIVQYLGEGAFASEYGEPVTGFWDADLQLYVACDAVDGFV